MRKIIIISLLSMFCTGLASTANPLHPEGQPAFSYEMVIVVDKAIRYAQVPAPLKMSKNDNDMELSPKSLKLEFF